MLKLRLIAGTLALLLVSSWAFAGLVLEDYERWQQYNGWPVRVIEFPGIRNFSREEALRVMATEKPTWLRRYVRLGSRTTFYANNFASDILRVEHFYQREGFPNTVVRGLVEPSDKRNELKLKVEITEGQPIILESWNIVMGSEQGAGVDSARWSQLIPIKIGKRLAASDIRISADTLRYKLREIGHARARVETRVETDSLRYTARLTFILYPGHFAWLGMTRISGLKQIEEQTARRELTYHELDPYSPVKLEGTRRKLVRLEAFTFVGVEADTTTPGDTLTVHIRTEEGTRYRVRFGGGYDTEERARGEVEFKDLNFFGRGRRFTFSGKLAELIRRAEIRLFWPHTPWNATDITLAPKWQIEFEQGFVLETQSGTTILSASPLERVNISMSNEAGRVRRRDKTDSTTTTYTKSVETASMGWDTRDNPLVPRNGHFLGLTLSESGAFYRTTLRWWRALLQGKVLIPANKFTVLAGKSELGIMGPLHDATETPIEERFYLGGPSTVRGWGRKALSPRTDDEKHTPIGGDIAFHFTTEIRRDIWGPVGVIAFCDVGNVWRNREALKPLNLYPSAGLGLAFLTPVGPVRTDVGYQLRPNPYGEAQWAFHFSLGTPF
jgi:outer membrane protein insertion porin family/translocation and assembly module TamA